MTNKQNLGILKQRLMIQRKVNQKIPIQKKKLSFTWVKQQNKETFNLPL